MREFFAFRGTEPLFAQPFLLMLSRLIALALLMLVVPFQYLLLRAQPVGAMQGLFLLGSVALIALLWNLNRLPTPIRWLIVCTAVLGVHWLFVFERGELTYGWLALCLAILIAFLMAGTIPTLLILCLHLLGLACLNLTVADKSPLIEITPLLSDMGVLLQMVAILYVLHRFVFQARARVTERTQVLNEAVQTQQRALSEATENVLQALDQAVLTRSQQLDGGALKSAPNGTEPLDAALAHLHAVVARDNNT